MVIVVGMSNEFSFLHFGWPKYVGLQNLVQHNDLLYGSGNAPTGGVALPFILVQVKLFDNILSLIFIVSVIQKLMLIITRQHFFLFCSPFCFLLKKMGTIV